MARALGARREHELALRPRQRARTGDPTEDPHVKKALGLEPDDAIVAFVYVGTPHETKEPKAVDLDGLVSEYGA